MAVYLITGATGFLGKLLLEDLLRRGRELSLEGVELLIRPQALGAGPRFREGLARSPCFSALGPGWSERVGVVAGDLSLPGCGLDAGDAQRLRERVTHVLHAAASVDFDLPLAAANAANATTALHAIELARGLARLRAFVSVSTAYATPHPGEGVPVEEKLAPLPGPAEELYAGIRSGGADEAQLLERSGHPNTYTFTKSLAEHLLVARGSELPLAIVRPSIISASWRRPFPGWIDSAAAFAGFVALIGAGHLRAVVGDPGTRVNLVPADWVARQVVDAAEDCVAGAPRIRHAVASASHSPRVEECRDAILRFFRERPAGRRPAIRYLGPAGARFRLADGLHNRAPVRLSMLGSSRQRRRGRRLLGQLEAMNRIFPYFTQRSFAFRASHPFDEPGFDRVGYLALVCEGVARHLLRSPAGGDPAGPRASRASPGSGS